MGLGYDGFDFTFGDSEEFDKYYRVKEQCQEIPTDEDPHYVHYGLELIAKVLDNIGNITGITNKNLFGNTRDYSHYIVQAGYKERVLNYLEFEIACLTEKLQENGGRVTPYVFDTDEQREDFWDDTDFNSLSEQDLMVTRQRLETERQHRIWMLDFKRQLMVLNQGETPVSKRPTVSQGESAPPPVKESVLTTDDAKLTPILRDLYRQAKEKKFLAPMLFALRGLEYLVDCPTKNKTARFRAIEKVFAGMDVGRLQNLNHYIDKYNRPDEWELQEIQNIKKDILAALGTK